MTEKIKKGDFVELNYTGKIKDIGAIFDSTIESVAKDSGIFDPRMTYGSISICVGEGQILKGLDENLVGLDVGKESSFDIPPELGFGKKDAKLMRLVPLSVFKKQGIRPAPGLQVNIDGNVGTVKTVSGGRVIVDFNHPFSGKVLEYSVNVIRVLDKDEDKIAALLELALNQTPGAIDIKLDGKTANVSLKKEFPSELLDILKARVIKLVDSVSEVNFKMPEKKGVVKDTTNDIVKDDSKAKETKSEN